MSVRTQCARIGPTLLSRAARTESSPARAKRARIGGVRSAVKPTERRSSACDAKAGGGLLGKRDRDDLTCAAIGDPQFATPRFHAGWLVQAFLQHRDMGAIAVHQSDRVNLARAILGLDHLAI